MSFGNQPSGRSSSFRRKSVKRKKQEFHRHKLHFLEEDEAKDKVESLDNLKSRVEIALTKLGEQRFISQEMGGGYTFENWMKNFNLLLDDFEARAGNLPKDYFDLRLELASSLLYSSRATGPETGSEISTLKVEERALKERIEQFGARRRSDRENEERRAKLAMLNGEQEQVQEQLESEQERLSRRRREVQDSRKFFKRVWAGLSKPPDETPLNIILRRIDDMKLRLDLLNGKVRDLEQVLSKEGEKLEAGLALGSEDDARRRLKEVEARLEELERERLEREELLPERREATARISELISRIECEGSSNSGSNTNNGGKTSPQFS